MAVSVYQPRAKEKPVEKDPLDTIMKGLNIAAGVYGLMDASQKRDALAQQMQSQKSAQEKEAQGVLTKKEFISSGANFMTSDENDPEATKFKLQTGPEEYKDIYLKPRPKGKTVDDYAAEQAKTLKDLQVQNLQSQIQERGTKFKEYEEKKAFEKTPEGKLSKLNTGDKQRLDNATLALQTVQGMADALQSGSNTFSLVGDNPYTQQRALFEEALGRMQSGGAISKGEEDRFKAMAPKVTDSAEMQQLKLNQLQSEFAKRVKTLGFKPDELGVTLKDISKSVPKSKGIADYFKAVEPQKANASPNRPPIMQNGVQYNFNSKTGKYE